VLIIQRDKKISCDETGSECRRGKS